MFNLHAMEDLKKHFGEIVKEVHVSNVNRITMTVDPASIVEVCRYLFSDRHFRFIIATALETKAGIEILYHFSRDASGLILNVRVVLDKHKTEVESLTGLFEAANWIEREMHEIMGIQFKNHPNLEKLISDGNWAEGVFPYRESDK
jgi:NADH-quinone oxidoreductase subunit C